MPELELASPGALRPATAHNPVGPVPARCPKAAPLARLRAQLMRRALAAKEASSLRSTSASGFPTPATAAANAGLSPARPRQLVALAAVGAPEPGRHEPAEEHPDGRQARDDDGDGGLETRPDHDVGVVPGGVPGPAEEHEEAQADAAGGEHEDAEAEHEQDPGLDAPGGVERQDPRHGEGQDGHVLRDAGAGRRVGDPPHVQAPVRAEGALPALPHVGDWDALEDLQAQEDEGREHHPGYDEEGGTPERRLREDAQVEAQDRELGQAQDGEVQRLVHIE